MGPPTGGLLDSERLSHVLDRTFESPRELPRPSRTTQKPVAVNLISLLSTIAMTVGLAASLPQIGRMLRTRSAGGQSLVGWGMGLVTNLSMAYVNLFGFGAAALMASNLLNAGLCVTAMALITRFNGPAAAGADDLAEATVIPMRPTLVEPLSDHRHLADMPTTEFVALSEAIAAASDHRAQRYRERDLLAA